MELYLYIKVFVLQIYKLFIKRNNNKFHEMYE